MVEDEESKQVEAKDAPGFQSDTAQKLNVEDKENAGDLEMIAQGEEKKDEAEGGQEEVIDFGVADNLKVSALRSETRPPASKVEVKSRETEPGVNAADDF